MLFACESEKEAPIEFNKFKDILKDMHLIESGIQNMSVNPQEKDKKGKEYFQGILKKHQIDKNKFNESLEYYIKHPKMLDSMYVLMLTETQIPAK